MDLGTQKRKATGARTAPFEQFDDLVFASPGKEFTEPTMLTDVKLIVEDRSLYAIKSLLALHSEVFQRMFYGEFKEKFAKRVELPDKKFDEIQELLAVITPSPTCRSVRGTNRY